MRRILRAGGVLLTLAALVLAWVVWRTFPRETGSVRTRGHAAAVRIETDARGVPTIRAQSMRRLFGLVRARVDRLWR